MYTIISLHCKSTVEEHKGYVVFKLNIHGSAVKHTTVQWRWGGRRFSHPPPPLSTTGSSTDTELRDDVKGFPPTRSFLKPNTWTYHFFQVFGHNLGSSQTWGFCMEFLNQSEGGMVLYQVFLLSPLQGTVHVQWRTIETVRGFVSLKKWKSQCKAVEVPVNNKEENF